MEFRSKQMSLNNKEVKVFGRNNYISKIKRTVNSSFDNMSNESFDSSSDKQSSSKGVSRASVKYTSNERI